MDELIIEILEDEEIEISIDESGGGGGDFPIYTGNYTVTPRKVDQTLETKRKSLLDNIKVEAITRSETSNPQGGKTIIIGFE